MSTEKQDASVAELVDAIDSKSVASNGVLVQVRPEVPIKIPSVLGRFFYCFVRGFTHKKTTSFKNEVV